MKRILLALIMTFALCATSFAVPPVKPSRDFPPQNPHVARPNPHYDNVYRTPGVYSPYYPPVFVHPTPYTKPYYGFYNYYPNDSYFYYRGSGIYLYVR